MSDKLRHVALKLQIEEPERGRSAAEVSLARNLRRLNYGNLGLCCGQHELDSWPKSFWQNNFQQNGISDHELDGRRRFRRRRFRRLARPEIFSLQFYKRGAVISEGTR